MPTGRILDRDELDRDELDRDERAVDMNDLKANVKILAKADVVAFGGVGFAGETLPETAAYFALAGQVARDPAAVRPHLDRLLDHATPAGRVYAATLLDEADPAAGQAAWRRLARDVSPVRTMTGCIAGHTTVAQYAASRARQPGQ
jgi:hypothetical protein